MDTWRTWELVLPALERRHEVLAVTLAGHAGGPPLHEPVDAAQLLDELEHALDQAGFELPHVAGNSLGGYVALRLAERGRARTVTALAPAGGWAPGDQSFGDAGQVELEMQRAVRAIAPQAEAFLASPEGRRAATQYTTVAYEHIPAALLCHQLRGVAACEGAAALVANAERVGFQLDASRIECPVRIVWGTEDRLLPWPSAAARFRDEWFAHADWVVLDGVGHCPQLDVPAQTADLILGFTS